MTRGIYPSLGRICTACDSTTTFIEKNGWPHWYCHDGNWMCRRCYRFYVVRPAYREKINQQWNKRQGPRRIWWTPEKRLIYVPEKLRKNVCSKCSKEGYTHFHHEQYHLDDPAKAIIELCASCHMKHHQSLKC